MVSFKVVSMTRYPQQPQLGWLGNGVNTSTCCFLLTMVSENCQRGFEGFRCPEVGCTTCLPGRLHMSTPESQPS